MDLTLQEQGQNRLQAIDEIQSIRLFHEPGTAGSGTAWQKKRAPEAMPALSGLPAGFINEGLRPCSVKSRQFTHVQLASRPEHSIETKTGCLR